jgi:hypothetical protein
METISQSSTYLSAIYEIMARDILGREITVGEYVVFHNRLYEVKESGARTSILIELVEKTKSTRPVRKMAKNVCVVSKGAVTTWMLLKEK